MEYRFERTISAEEFPSSILGELPFVLTRDYGHHDFVLRTEWHDDLTDAQKLIWYRTRDAIPSHCAGDVVWGVQMVHTYNSDLWWIRYAFRMNAGKYDHVYAWIIIMDELIALQVKLMLS